MKNVRSYGIVSAILLMQLAAIGFGQPQTPVNPVLTCEQVTAFMANEKSGAFSRNYTKDRIEEFGVDFKVDTDCGSKLVRENPDLREPIVKAFALATLTVQCEPVECEVQIDNDVAGTTVGSLLRKSGVKPGSMMVKVTAPNHEPQTREVSVARAEDMRVPKFTMVPLKGELAITCAPAPVCGITIKGPDGFLRKGATSQGRYRAQGLALGGYEIEATAAPAFFPHTEKIWVSGPDVRTLAIKLEEDPWGSKTDLQIFDAVVSSLGGKEVLTVGSLSKNTARMRMAGDPPSIGMWNGIQVVEYQAPNRLRWDLTIAGSKWQVFYDGTKAVSKGDKKYAGTQFAQELEYSIRLFSTMKLPFILSMIRAKFDIKKGPPQVMIAESPDERYTFHLNEDFFPVKVVRERLTVPVSTEEMEFGALKSIGQDLMLPHVIVLRYKDRPEHEHIFQYDEIDTTAQIRENLFKP